MTSQKLTCVIFCCLFDRLPIQILTSDLHLHRILWKKSIRPELVYNFSLQFSYNNINMMGFAKLSVKIDSQFAVVVGDYIICINQ